MRMPNFYGDDIEEDLGIPLSYDAAWKIFNRWPREVRGQHQRLGQRTTPSKHETWCFCQEKNCTTRCPFFGFYSKKDGPTENKLHGIMSHKKSGERGTSQNESLLRNLNKWYNIRCAAGSSQVLDLSKLEQFQIKYKYPVLTLNKTNSSRRFRRRDSRSVFYHNTKYKPPTMTSKAMKHSKANNRCGNTELYYTIEKQLRNLSVSQSRLKHMNASLCRLAYAKKRASRMKLRPKIYKRKVGRRYRSDIPIVSNNESTANTNTSKMSNFCSKSSRNSKSTKSTDKGRIKALSKGSKTSGSNKSSKGRKATKRMKSSKNKKASKSTQVSKSSKLSTSSKTTESTKASKSTKVSESSKVNESSKTSKTSKTNKTSESSKTSESYKSISGSKITNTSKNSGSCRGKDTSKSGYNSKIGKTSKSKATNKKSVSSKSTNVKTVKAISHPVVRSIRFNLAKSKRAATRSAGDEEVNCKRKATGSIIKEQAKVAKPQIHRLGGGNVIPNRTNRMHVVAWNSGAGAVNRKQIAETAPKPNTKFTSNHLAPTSCLIKKHNKRYIFIDAGGGGDAEVYRGGRCKITRKPSVRISKPILSLFRKKRPFSKQSMTKCGQKSGCFFNKCERLK